RIIEGALGAAPALDLLYTDHDHVAADGRLVDPVLKPGWSPSLRGHPQFRSRGWIARSSLFGGEVSAALAMSAGAPVHVKQVGHLPVPLLSASHPGPSAQIAATASAATPSVSVIIPTRIADREMLARCLDGLRQRTDYPDLQIVVVLNNLAGIDMAEARGFLARWSVQVLHRDGAFNWSSLNNFAASHADGELLLFLNDDVEPMRPDWLRAMVEVSSAPDVGAVGAVLHYPDGSIQHAGIYIDCRRELDSRHSFRHCAGDEPRLARWLRHERTQTAVTGACLLSRRSVFEEAGGFDEAFPLVFNDVDYCLRLQRRGRRSAVAAAAHLLHHEGFSRDGMSEAGDRARFCARWQPSLPAVDPHSHPALDHQRDDWMIDLRAPPVVELRLFAS
ncbi:MAG TPA: glycosyltransferase, partial [Albitalea sp.]|nr:glycosyltransferase [Albitalea sp.]